jgi:hypothetical protein
VFLLEQPGDVGGSSSKALYNAAQARFSLFSAQGYARDSLCDQLLVQWANGDKEALDDLTPLDVRFGRADRGW